MGNQTSSSEGRTSRSAEEQEYLSLSGANIYNANYRTLQDKWWTVVYCTLAAVTLVWSVVSLAMINPDAVIAFEAQALNFYGSSLTCDVQKYKEAIEMAEHALQDSAPGFFRPFVSSMAMFLPMTAAAGLLGAVGYIALFCAWPRTMVRWTLRISLALAVLWSLTTVIAAFGFVSILFLVVALVFCVLYYRNREAIDNTAGDLLGLAGRALKENALVVVAVLGIKLVGWLLLLLMSSALVAAVTVVGKIQPNALVAKRLPSQGADDIGICYDANGAQVYCCALSQPPGTTVFVVLAAICCAWTVQLVYALKLYVVADTIAQWYFMPKILASTGPSQRPAAAIARALRNAFTSNFGTVACAAALLTLINWLRNAVQRAARRNLLCCIMNACCLQPLLALLRQFSAFATISAAITGLSFVPAAKSVYATLSRNLMKTYNVWWVPAFVLHVTLFFLSAVWTSLITAWSIVHAQTFYVKAAAASDSDPSGTSDPASSPSGSAADGSASFNDLSPLVGLVTGLLSFLLMYALLYFAASLLLDAVNTLYICYAMDKDARTVTQPEVHDAYSKVPGLFGSGAVVQNPDGNLLYAAPDPEAGAMGREQAQPLLSDGVELGGIAGKA